MKENTLNVESLTAEDMSVIDGGCVLGVEEGDFSQ